MNNTMKLGVTLILGAVALIVAINLVRSAMSLIIPLALIGGVGLIAYSFINRKALGGGNRYLP